MVKEELSPHINLAVYRVHVRRPLPSAPIELSNLDSSPDCSIFQITTHKPCHLVALHGVIPNASQLVGKIPTTSSRVYNFNEHKAACLLCLCAVLGIMDFKSINLITLANPNLDGLNVADGQSRDAGEV